MKGMRYALMTAIFPIISGVDRCAYKEVIETRFNDTLGLDQVFTEWNEPLWSILFLMIYDEKLKG